MYIYWQQEGGQGQWNCAMLRDREQVIAARQPRFVTVLAVNKSVESLPREELEHLKYLGPFYADFDSDDVERSIKQFNRFLSKFEAAGANLETLRLYATGGRGFHVELPIETFMPKPPKDGLANLPAIYKEIAYRVVVDSLDLRVYSAKRGRMWRTPNVQRENGAYKVPISLAEARDMTPEMYVRLCSTPREYGKDVPEPQAATLSPDLAVLFSQAQDTIVAAVKKRKSGKKDQALLSKFKGKVPTTLTAIMGNVGLREDAGWNQIAMQVAISLNALGKTEDEIVEESRVLIDEHAGDSDRYGTPAKREEELRMQIAYTADNPCYSFSVGAIKSLLAPGVAAPDLEGITDEAQAADHAAAMQIIENADGDVDEHTGKMVVGKAGIRVQTAEGWSTLSVVGIDNVVRIRDLITGTVIAFDADIYYRGAPVGRHIIGLDSFASRSKLNAFFTSISSGTFIGTDIHAAFVQEWLVLMSSKGKGDHPDEHARDKEGLDLVKVSRLAQVPDEAREPFLLMSSPHGCFSTAEIEATGMRFRFRGQPNAEGLHKSDLMLGPDLSSFSRSEVVKAMSAILGMNRDAIVAGALGWFCAAHARMLYHAIAKQFPLIQFAGQAGSGKSSSSQVFMCFHYWKEPFKLLQCDGSSYYSIATHVAASCSIPTLLDEYKPATINFALLGRLRALLRGAYDNGAYSKGGGEQKPSSNGREIMASSFSSPIIFLGETLETETAIQERSVSALFIKEVLAAYEQEHRIALASGDIYSAVGKQIVLNLLDQPFEDFRAGYDADYAAAKAKIYSGGNFRVVHNYAVVRNGLLLLKQALNVAGITELDERIEELREEAIEIPMKDGALQQGRAASEISKVLNTFSTMSHMIPANGEALLKAGVDYGFSSVGDKDLLEINVPFVWSKYEVWQQQRGKTPLYPDQNAFEIALATMLMFDRDAEHLKGASNVMRLPLDKLTRERVAPFKPGAGRRG